MYFEYTGKKTYAVPHIFDSYLESNTDCYLKYKSGETGLN